MDDARDMRVLIAEDDYLVSKMVRGLLEEIGHPVVGVASNGVEAIRLTEELRPDVVVMDIKMPDKDGIEATEHILERCPTPVVILTAYETPELVERATAAGVGAYLVKPVSAQELKRAITVAVARFGDLIALHGLNRELQARNEDLDAFAHTVAHDLKDLLARIVGYASTLEDAFAELPPDEVRGYLHTIAESGIKMSDVIDALLLLTGVRQIEVEMRPLDMAAVLNEVFRRLKGMIGESGAEIIVPDSWPVALGHSLLVEEVWFNYLTNAIKYGGTPPRVEVGADRLEEGYVRFWVRDNGSGIPATMYDRLFKPFARLDQAHGKGYGLGLSIVRRIVEKLGGSVSVSSEVGEGSLFAFTLPVAQAQSDPCTSEEGLGCSQDG